MKTTTNRPARSGDSVTVGACEISKIVSRTSVKIRDGLNAGARRHFCSTSYAIKVGDRIVDIVASWDAAIALAGRQ